jgi:hypothetical protein
MFAKRVIAGILSVVVLTQLVACGTILHPERKGQINGRLDPAIVILDAVGLFFFLVPGVVAFAVDFSNGTIYLPGGKRADGSAPSPDVRMVYIGEDVRDPHKLENVIRNLSGKAVDFNHQAMQTLAIADHQTALLTLQKQNF